MAGRHRKPLESRAVPPSGTSDGLHDGVMSADGSGEQIGKRRGGFVRDKVQRDTNGDMIMGQTNKGHPAAG